MDFDINRPRQPQRQPRRSMDDIRGGRISYDRFSADYRPQQRQTPPQSITPVQNTPSAPSPTPRPTPVTPPAQQAPAPQPTPSIAQESSNYVPQPTPQTPIAERPPIFTPAAQPATPSKRKISSKTLRILAISGIALVCLAVLAFVFSQGFLFGEFKTVKIKNSQGSYALAFYKKSTRKAISDNTQLVSSVSKGGKLPVVVSVEYGDTSAYEKLKTCDGMAKVTQVTNKNVKQDITICDTAKRANKPGAYVAGFVYKDKLHIINIGQDLSSTNGQDTVEKYGLDPYKADLEKIVASIKVK